MRGESMVSGRKSRWKSGGAADAELDPMSLLYEEIRTWSPIEARLAQGCVLLNASPRQASILSRACFGQLIVSAAVHATAGPRDAHLPARPPRILVVEGNSEGLMFQLGFEEAFFLSYELNWLRICHSASFDGLPALSHEEVWSRLLQEQPLFGQRYKGFSYLRERRWVVRSGHQYGADFLAYRHHPELVHSEYAVIIVAEDEVRQRLSTWTDIHAMSRLCGSVSKTLLLLHIVSNGSPVRKNSFEALKDYFVEAVQVQRWLPEEHRSAKVLDISSEAVESSCAVKSIPTNIADLSGGSHES